MPKSNSKYYPSQKRKKRVSTLIQYRQRKREEKLLAMQAMMDGNVFIFIIGYFIKMQ